MCIESCLFAPIEQTDTQHQTETQGNMDIEIDHVNAELNSVFTTTNTTTNTTTPTNNPNTTTNSSNTPNITNNPTNMATKFNVPYLGSLPMDRNLMEACELGLGFIENYPNSIGVKPLQSIVNKIINITDTDADNNSDNGTEK